MIDSDPKVTGQSEPLADRVFWFIPVVFVLLAGLLLADPFRESIPLSPRVEVPDSATDVTPVRNPTIKPETVIARMTYRCSECHDLFPSPAETDRPLSQHRHIRLEHGINARCFNCHHRDNRNVFADDRGDAIPFDQPPLLCAKCHGPVYRDWTHGVHGRTNGYWDSSAGPVRRLKCVECHDPHTPAFGSMKPAPGPRTLRMGEQGHRPIEPDENKNPLLIYRQVLSGRDIEHEPSK